MQVRDTDAQNRSPPPPPHPPAKNARKNVTRVLVGRLVMAPVQINGTDFFYLESGW